MANQMSVTPAPSAKTPISHASDRSPAPGRTARITPSNTRSAPLAIMAREFSISRLSTTAVTILKTPPRMARPDERHKACEDAQGTFDEEQRTARAGGRPEPGYDREGSVYYSVGAVDDDQDIEREAGPDQGQQTKEDCGHSSQEQRPPARPNRLCPGSLL